MFLFKLFLFLLLHLLILSFIILLHHIRFRIFLLFIRNRILTEKSFNDNIMVPISPMPGLAAGFAAGFAQQRESPGATGPTRLCVQRVQHVSAGQTCGSGWNILSKGPILATGPNIPKSQIFQLIN